MIWVPDGQNLYLTILYYTRDYVVKVVKTLLATGQLVLPQWDFSIGQGSSVLSVFHFNPLFLLAIFTPYRWMEAVCGAVTVLQIPWPGWRLPPTAGPLRSGSLCPSWWERWFTPSPAS